MFSKTSVYVIRAMIILAKLPPESYAGAVSIAKEIGAPQNYLGKMLKTLAQEGLITSQKGYGGGFRLAKSPDEITLFDVVDPIEQVGQKKTCILGSDRCSDNAPCALHSKWKKLHQYYMEILQSTTLSDLVSFYNRNEEGYGLYEIRS